MNVSGVNQAVTNSKIGYLPADPEARLRKAASEFEAIWLQRFLKEARPKNQMFESSFAAQTFRDMLDETLAKTMAQRGVLGFADMMVEQMKSKFPIVDPAEIHKAEPTHEEGLVQ